VLDHTERLEELFPAATEATARRAIGRLDWPVAMRIILLLSCSAWMVIALLALALGII
jgi:hypothetical protein